MQRSGLASGPRAAGPRQGALGSVLINKHARFTRCSSNGSAETSTSHPVPRVPHFPQQLGAAALLVQMRDWTQRIGQWMRHHRLQQLLFVCVLMQRRVMGHRRRNPLASPPAGGMPRMRTRTRASHPPGTNALL